MLGGRQNDKTDNEFSDANDPDVEAVKFKI